MKTLAYIPHPRYRLAFGLTFLSGMALCTAGIRHTTEAGWLHPVSLLGITLGLLALGLGGGVLFRRKLGPISGDQAALWGLLGLIAVKCIVGLFYPAVP